MSFPSEHLAIARLKSPRAPSRRLLAYLHSGDVLRHSLPKLLRSGAVAWLIASAVLWIAYWPAVYREFERWGLVRAFFAQMIFIVTIVLAARITTLRAAHLEALPADDFVSLRAVAVFCRWLGEIALLYAAGMGLSSLLMTGNVLMTSLLGDPSTVSETGSASRILGFLSGTVSMLMVFAAAMVFLFFYSVATAIDVWLAIEFNTRAERAGKGMLYQAVREGTPG